MKVNETEIRPGEPYTGGIIFSVMSCVIIGSFALGGASSNWKIVTEARVAGKMAHDTISHQPEVDPNTKGKLVKPNEIKGRIEF